MAFVTFVQNGMPCILQMLVSVRVTILRILSACGAELFSILLLLLTLM